MENKRIGINEFENTIIPDGWARCFNEACRQHYSCVRFKAGEALSENQTEGCSVYPNAVKKDGVCKYYKAYKTILTAWGFRKIMENIKVTDANAIRQELRLFFGNNSRYYRYFNGKRRLTEKQKVWIEKLFPDFVIVSPKNLRQRVLLFSDVLPSALFGYKPPCSEVA